MRSSHPAPRDISSVPYSPPMTVEPASKSSPVPHWLKWGGLGLMLVYQAAMYGGIMRIVVSGSVLFLPWLIRQPGYALYKNILVQYTPGGLWLWAALDPLCSACLGRIRLEMIIVTSILTLLVFFLSRRLWSDRAGLVGAALLAIWGPVFMDHLMYFEVIMGLMLLFALMVWHKPSGEWWRPWVAGIFVGLAVLVKQHALAVVGIFIVWRLLVRGVSFPLKDNGLFLLGVGVVLALGALALVFKDHLQDALFWAWSFNWGPYLRESSRLPDASTVLLLLAWLSVVGIYAWTAIRSRRVGTPELLMLGLIPALLLPAFPRFGRFHLGAAVPIVALVGAGASPAMFTRPGKLRNKASLLLSRLVVWGEILLHVVALALPTYYRVKLGPLVDEYAPLVPVADALTADYGLRPGERLWNATEVDPTFNLYAIGGFLPPRVWVPVYPWFQSVPGVTERVRTAVAGDPPPVAVVFERWRPLVPHPLIEHLEANYERVGVLEVPDEYGTVTIYRLLP